MGDTSQRLHAFEWVGCTLWVVVWGSLAYIALTERSVTLGGGKSGLGGTHFDGDSAVTIGIVLLGVAVLGIAWLFRLNRYRRLLHAILGLAFAATFILYVTLFKP